MVDENIDIEDISDVMLSISDIGLDYKVWHNGFFHNGNAMTRWSHYSEIRAVEIYSYDYNKEIQDSTEVRSEINQVLMHLESLLGKPSEILIDYRKESECCIKDWMFQSLYNYNYSTILSKMIYCIYIKYK